jgi:peptide deformylase
MQLVLSPNPILSQVTEPWDFATDQDPEVLEKEMIKIMQTFQGIGLSANQVGILKRVFVIKLQNNAEPFAMFNPSVIKRSDAIQTSNEGCLSFPNLWLDIPRPQVIESEYFDITGKQCTITLTGIDARCFLHELDHLNGVVFTEHVSQMKLILARKKQRKNNGRTKR